MRSARALLRSAFRSAASLPLAARGGLDRLDIEEFAGRSKRALEALCRARAQPVYLGGSEALCRILGRYKLYVDTRDKGLGAHLLARRLLGNGSDDAHRPSCARGDDGDRCRGQFRLLHDPARGAGRRGGPCPGDRAGAGNRRDAAPLGRAERVRGVHERDRGRRRHGRSLGSAALRARARAEKRPDRRLAGRSQPYSGNLAPGRASADRRARGRPTPHRLHQDRRRGRRGGGHCRRTRDLAARQAASGARIQRRPRSRPRRAARYARRDLRGAALSRPARQHARHHARAAACARASRRTGWSCSEPADQRWVPISRSSSRWFCPR